MNSTKVVAAIGAAIFTLCLGACSAAPKAAPESPSESQAPKSSESPSESQTSNPPETAHPTVLAQGKDTKLSFPKSPAPEGLTVWVAQEGTGPVVKETDTVTANYVGQVWGNSTPFDSSFSRGEPASFSLQRVIPGWTQGLKNQKVGAKVILSIPPAMGYGPDGGRPEAGIGANDFIAFYVEIVDATA